MTDEKMKEAIEFAAAAAFSILIEAYPDLEKLLIPQIVLEHHIRVALNEILNQKKVR